MALECCLLAFGIGNAADWAAVGVGAWTALIAALAAVIGIAGTAATVWVALLAHRTSKRAAEIAEDATKIASQQHQEAVNLREENARIIGRLLLYEVIALPARISAMVKSLETGVDFGGDHRIKDGRAMNYALDEAELPLLPGAERVEDRIHNLPDSIGADLATLIGGSRTLGELVRKIRSRTVRPTGVNPAWRYDGNMIDFDILRNQLKWLGEISDEFAGDFREFVGVAPDEEFGPAQANVDQ